MVAKKAAVPAGPDLPPLDPGLIVVANLDPHAARETTVHLDLSLLGLAPGSTYGVRELITGQHWTWSDSNFVRLDAFAEPVHILSIDYASVPATTAKKP